MAEKRTILLNLNCKILQVDLTNVFQRNCTDTDYKDWSPVAPGEGENTKTRCILGKKEVYKRRAPSANCYNGKLLFNKGFIKCRQLLSQQCCRFGLHSTHKSGYLPLQSLGLSMRLGLQERWR